MHRLFYAFVALSILNAVIYAQSYNQSLNLLAQSYSAPSVNTLLQGYNISNTIIASLIYTKVNFSGNTYLLASLSGRPSLLINTTGSVYSLVLNTGQVSSIIGPGIIQSSLKQINTTYLTVAMQKYNASSSGPLNRCLESTGLSTGATCTYANNCQACTQIPACGGVTRANFQSAFYATGGIYGPLAAGIMQLEAEYANLTKNFSRYYSSVRTLNASNAQTNVGLIEASFSNISTITSNIYQNPIFPPPQTADYNQCSGVGAGTGNVPTSGPWYCSSLGFCEFLTYNYTLLGNIQSYLGSIEALPLSQSQVSQTATNITEFESTYAAPILNQKEHEQALGIANTVLPGYNSFVSGSQ
ncbi:MAG: hypothetical protein KGH64_02835, partial [Candidatus Micrarchaeota archaeon]|nr:hypothetical protein [Candidatus Micrarchaeota archaeon]